MLKVFSVPLPKAVIPFGTENQGVAFMQTRVMALALGVAAATAHADQPPQPQPAAPGGMIAQAKANNRVAAALVASPVVMETSAQVMPDGTVRFNCEQKANPHPVQVRVQKPNAEQKP